MLASATFAVAMLAGTGSAFAQNYYGPQPYYGQHWRGEGAEQAIEQRGFRDGVFGADRDFQNHRRPDVNNRDEYRDARDVPTWAAHEYREGFRRGYYHRVQEIYRGGYGYR
jgi:hypothetical protein